ncbi:MAG: 5-formyltetrahydrofolate cyclo-ligase, partial [Gammaproteobacteria bacterium]
MLGRFSDSSPADEDARHPPDRRAQRALRATYRRLRRALSTETQRQHASDAARAALVSGLLLGARCVALYLPSDGELSPLPLAARLRQRGVRIVLPIVCQTPLRGPHLRFRLWSSDTRLQLNRFGIPEPDARAPTVPTLAIDRLLLPLTAFDPMGTRLGMGGGYYDRLLGGMPDGLRPRVIGFAHALQESMQPLPRAPWDQPLDAVVTERGWRCFGAQAATPDPKRTPNPEDR